MKWNFVRGRLLCLSVSTAGILLDRLLKFWAESLPKGGRETAIPYILNFAYTNNTGAAFSLFRENPLLIIVFNAMLLLLLLFVLLLPNSLSMRDRLCFSLIFAGGAGNLWDRLLFGHVVDYLEFAFIEFPIFNFADVCIVVGTVLLMLFILIPKKNRKKEENHVV